jgi:signal transduction histidine kinase
MIAGVLPRIWERDPGDGQRRLGELARLTQGALAEMRALLLELRPEALVGAELEQLLRQLADAATVRLSAPVQVTVEGACCLPVEVKVALYRIAQEALSNVVKHAGASQAAVSLYCEPGLAELSVADDGRGFDPERAPTDRLGLRIMHERAREVGATLEIKSEPDRGTQVIVTWEQVGTVEGSRT